MAFMKIVGGALHSYSRIEGTYAFAGP